MNYPRYEAYKDSGIEWVGKVPSHWCTRPLFTVMQERDEQNVGNREKNVLSLSYGRVVRRNVDSNLGLLPESFETYQIVEPGNIILRLTDLQNDQRSLRVGLVRERGIITSAYLCLVPKANIDYNFASYLLHSYDLYKVFYGFGGGVRQAMKFQDLKRLPILIPPIPEQRTIASFLDRETARIATLIAKQEQTINLLQEKRKAIINHAVTRGLDPKVSLRDSSVDWLGLMPEHWRVRRLKNLIASFDQGWSPQCENRPAGDHEWGVLKVGCVNRDQFNHAENKALPADIKPLTDYIIRQDDVLISRANTRELVGSAAVVRRDYPNLLLCDKLYRLRLDKHKVLPEFVVLLLRTPKIRRQIEIEATGASQSMQNIAQDTIRSLYLALPPIEEQQIILSYIHEQVVILDCLVEKVQAATDLLKEHRTSLILAAVTGKIDVRAL